MVYTIKYYKKPKLENPILIEGLPGIGLIGNIAVAYLIKTTDASLYSEFKSDSFPDIAVIDNNNLLKSPFCRLYYHQGRGKSEQDLLFLFGNTQALTCRGQYELCGAIIDEVSNQGCNYVVTLGGYRPGREVTRPNIYFATTDPETGQLAKSLGAQALQTPIYGIAGLLIGIAALHNKKGLCVLSETSGSELDLNGAHAVLDFLSKFFSLDFNLKGLINAEELADFITPFDFGTVSEKEKKARERFVKTKPDWFI